MLHILYFASLREAVGCGSERMALPMPRNVGGLIVALRSRGGVWQDALGAEKRWRIAVNQQMAESETPLSPGDEVAIFPPVTGG